MSIKSSSSSSSSSTKPIDSSSIEQQKRSTFDRKRFIYEQYPKTDINERCFSSNSARLRSNGRFRTQPITLTEINETEEENKFEQDEPTSNKNGRIEENFGNLQHLALSENIRRSARKKAPLKNYTERQRLKSMREETSESDGN